MAEYIDKAVALSMREPPKSNRFYQTNNLDDAYEQGWDEALSCIEKIPASDVAPVVHGRWISKNPHGYEWTFVCSNCGYVDGYPFNDRHNYCSNCGAKMEEQINEKY